MCLNCSNPLRKKRCLEKKSKPVKDCPNGKECGGVFRSTRVQSPKVSKRSASCTPFIAAVKKDKDRAQFTNDCNCISENDKCRRKTPEDWWKKYFSKSQRGNLWESCECYEKIGLYALGGPWTRLSNLTATFSKMSKIPSVDKRVNSNLFPFVRRNLKQFLIVLSIQVTEAFHDEARYEHSCCFPINDFVRFQMLEAIAKYIFKKLAQLQCGQFIEKTSVHHCLVCRGKLPCFCNSICKLLSLAMQHAHNFFCIRTCPHCCGLSAAFVVPPCRELPNNR